MLVRGGGLLARPELCLLTPLYLHQVTITPTQQLFRALLFPPGSEKRAFKSPLAITVLGAHSLGRNVCCTVITTVRLDHF